MREELRGTALAQGHLWTGSPRNWTEYQEPPCAPLIDVMLGAERIGAGQRVADVGCGSNVDIRLPGRIVVTTASQQLDPISHPAGTGA